jgi:uncharacterized protein (DUF58 family)
LAFSAINNNDKVGVLFFTDRIEKFIPPKKGKQHILRIIRELLNFEPEGKGTDIGKAMEYLNNLIKKRSITFVLSDFMSTGYETPLRIAARRHDVIGMHLYDIREAELPNVGLIRAVDAETGEVGWIDTAIPEVRKAYANNFTKNLDYFKNAFRKTGADTVSLRTDEKYVNTLLRFFKKRAK